MAETLQNTLLILTPLLFLADLAQSLFYIKERKAFYYTCFVAFFAAMMFALLATSLPLMWVAVELTTLVSAPLIAHSRSRESLEAMWKYLLICSIGIGLALFGTMLVLHAQTTGNQMWYKVGFAFVLAGYGTKTGLAPFHTWLPDAHSEAPAPVSALLSGALLNCSFYAIVRFRSIMPQEVAPFCDGAMTVLGLLSVAVAAVFMVRQADYKRLLAYSSVEHMGLNTLIFALGPFQTILICHVCAHSLTKTMLFLTAGNLLHAFKTRSIAAVQGLGVSMKGHAALWICGLFLICGMPPSLLFLTELGLVVSAPFWAAATVLAILFIVFSAMLRVGISMTMGCPTTRPAPLPGRLSVVPWTLLALLAALGIAGSVHLLRTLQAGAPAVFS